MAILHLKTMPEESRQDACISCRASAETFLIIYVQSDNSHTSSIKHLEDSSEF